MLDKSNIGTSPVKMLWFKCLQNSQKPKSRKSTLYLTDTPTTSVRRCQMVLCPSIDCCSCPCREVKKKTEWYTQTTVCRTDTATPSICRCQMESSPSIHCCTSTCRAVKKQNGERKQKEFRTIIATTSVCRCRMESSPSIDCCAIACNAKSQDETKRE